MELHNLKPAEGAVRKGKRKGRGQGSTDGGTSGRGHKGAQARSGYKAKKGHEGGQMPLQRRLPKRGFNNIFRVEYTGLNLGRLQEIAEKHNVTEMSLDFLRQNGYLSKMALLKVLGNGELKTKLSIEAHAGSASAKSKIEALGGSINLVK